MTHTVGPHEVEALIAAGDMDVVDVRELREWQTGHVPGARLVPLDQLRADPKTALPRDKVLFVCQKGMRSLTAAKIAEELGHKEVYSLEGGTSAWSKAGLPITIPPDPRALARSGAKGAPAPLIESPEPALDAIVGENVRELRNRRGLSLDALAKLTGISRTTLGQIELGKNVPSVATVWKIARAFDVHFSTLLATPGRVATSLLRRKTAKRLVSADGRFTSRALFPFGEQQQVEFYELWLAARGREDAEAHAPGTRENLVVTKGRLELEVGGERFELAEGDAIVFGADVPHAYVNPANEECWMHLVMSYTDPLR